MVVVVEEVYLMAEQDRQLQPRQQAAVVVEVVLGRV
jgi:hypothetical protein